MAHSGPFRCQCGQIHGDIYDGPSNDLLPYIDVDGICAHNEAERGAVPAHSPPTYTQPPASAPVRAPQCRNVFKPYDRRLDREGFVESEEDDPQIIIHIPFISPVKIRALSVIGGADGETPRELRAFINRETLDFSDADALAAPVQQWEIAERDPTGGLEYPTQYSRFQSVSRLSLFVADNHGADRTRIYYIGLKGVGTDHKRRAVQAVYELKPMAEASDIKALGSCAQVE